MVFPLNRQPGSGPVTPDTSVAMPGRIDFASDALENGNVVQDEYMAPAAFASSPGKLLADIETQLFRTTRALSITQLEIQQRSPATTGAAGRDLTYNLVTVSEDFLTITPTGIQLVIDALESTLQTVTPATPLAVAAGTLLGLEIDHGALGVAGTDWPTDIVATLSTTESLAVS